MSTLDRIYTLISIEFVGIKWKSSDDQGNQWIDGIVLICICMCQVKFNQMLMKLATIHHLINFNIVNKWDNSSYWKPNAIPFIVVIPSIWNYNEQQHLEVGGVDESIFFFFYLPKVRCSIHLVIFSFFMTRICV